jgi:UDP-N-acetylglucosamine:LPS N-acetylglucosamine transferase
MTRVVIVSARIGAGHDGAARELARRFRAQGLSVDCVDFLDLLPRRVGNLLCGVYRRQLTAAPRSWGWLLAALGTSPLDSTARRFARLAVARLVEVLGSDVALAVSTYPLATHALAVVKTQGQLVAPLVVYLTDPAVHRLSVSPDAEITIAPNEIAAGQARERGAGHTIVARPLVRPEFRPVSTPAERDRLRVAFGLPIRQPLALVLSGSWGTGQITQTTTDIVASEQAVPVVVCGRNDALRARLTRAGDPFVFGWVDNMPDLIRACDVVVQNAGGLSASEALASGVPVLTYRCLPGHGRTNAAALDAAGTVPWIRSAVDLKAGLASALAQPNQTSPTPERAAFGMVG